MKKKVFNSLLIIIIAFVVYRTFMISMFFMGSSREDNKDPAKKDSMIECTLKWGRLAKFPDSKREFDIYTEGSSFTRSFRCNFYLPKSDLDKWIEESSGLKDAEIQTIAPSKEKYIIKPGEGANYAEAVIDFQKCYVEIYVSWS